ncbi:putative cleavage-induced protein [Thraustotheca clavata]|uniref:Putative cleavage-induced protein n=1 Tax=Thraustotheca clavata TaxID=74557 RepID=A0A1V9ZD22_9STRA|nr:putative cleavage-induced protein [Thraustotheca clavata]
MSRKGVKMGLSDFLSTNDGGHGPADALPRGPRAREDGDDGYRGRERREQREPMRSEGSDRWRGDRGGFRGGDDGFRGNSFRGNRDEPRYEERPAHMRLNLSRRGEEPSAAASGSSFRSNDRNQDDDKFSRAFARSGDSGRFGDRYGGNDRYGGDRFGGNDRFSSRQDSGRFGDRYNDGMDRLNTAFERQTVSEPREDPAEAARKKKEEERAARAAEKAKKEAERKEAKRLAEEAAAKAAEEKKAAAEADAKAAVREQEIMAAILATGKKGDALVAAAKPIVKTTKINPAVVMATLLKHNQFTATSSIKWMTPEEYGAFMVQYIGQASHKDQLKAIYALQLFMHENRGPDGSKTKGMMEMSFKALYAFDIIADEAFLEYKYDVDDNTPGKMQAFIETSEWLSWLETNDDEDEDEEDEDEY